MRRAAPSKPVQQWSGPAALQANGGLSKSQLKKAKKKAAAARLEAESEANGMRLELT